MVPAAKIGTVPFDEQVGWFDVAVEDAVLVGVVEGLGGLDAELGDGAEVLAAGEGRQC
jgi:hypothetical protein